MTREEHKEIFIGMAEKSKEEINAMCDTGMFNEIIKGYCLIALRQLERHGLIDQHISENDVDFRGIFDEFNAYDARQKVRDQNL